MNRLKKSDNVIIISGKNKGFKGSITSICYDKNRVIVEGANFVTKHVKPNPNKGIEGGVVKKESSIHMSNVALYNSTLGRADRIGFKLTESGKKVRYFKSNNELLSGGK
jgi:large subunit ribosomal protein L24